MLKHFIDEAGQEEKKKKERKKKMAGNDSQREFDFEYKIFVFFFP